MWARCGGATPSFPILPPDNQQHGGTQDCEERVLAHLRVSGNHAERGDDELREAVETDLANIVCIEVQDRWVPAEVRARRTPCTPPRGPPATPRPTGSAPMIALQPGPSRDPSSLVVLPNVQKKRKIAALIQEVKGTQETVDNASRMFEIALNAFRAESDRLANIMQELRELS